MQNSFGQLKRHPESRKHWIPASAGMTTIRTFPTDRTMADVGFDFDRLRSGPFEGPAIVKPPALPGDTYSNFPRSNYHSLRTPWLVLAALLQDLLSVLEDHFSPQHRQRGPAVDLTP